MPRLQTQFNNPPTQTTIPPSPTNPTPKKLDVSGISWLLRGLFPAITVVLDSVLVTSNSPLTLNITAAFPLTQQGEASQNPDF